MRMSGRRLGTCWRWPRAADAARTRPARTAASRWRRSRAAGLRASRPRRVSPARLRPRPTQPLAHEVDVQPVGQRHGRHRGARLLALGQNLRLELGAVDAPLGFGLHRCPPVRIGGHHRHERLSAVQGGMAGRSLKFIEKAPGGPRGVLAWPMPVAPAAGRAGEAHGGRLRQAPQGPQGRPR